MKWKKNFMLTAHAAFSPIISIWNTLFYREEDFLIYKEINFETLEFYTSFTHSIRKYYNTNKVYTLAPSPRKITSTWPLQEVDQALFAKPKSRYSVLHLSETVKPFTLEISKSYCFFKEQWCWSRSQYCYLLPHQHEGQHLMHHISVPKELKTRGWKWKILQLSYATRVPRWKQIH